MAMMTLPRPEVNNFAWEESEIRQHPPRVVQHEHIGVPHQCLHMAAVQRPTSGARAHLSKQRNCIPSGQAERRDIWRQERVNPNTTNTWSRPWTFPKHTCQITLRHNNLSMGVAILPRAFSSHIGFGI